MTHQDYLNLVSDINLHNELYYVQSAPVLSDTEFDVMFSALKEAEREHPEWISPDSPTQRPGSDLAATDGKVIHNHPMLSLDKVFTAEDVVAWYNRMCKKLGVDSLEIVAEPKFDGLTCSIIYEGGNLVQASTRGDGYVGSDVTEAVKYIANVPKDRVEKGRVEVIGEVLMPFKAFEQCNASGESFANPRNAASGTLKHSDATLACERGLEFYPFNVYFGRGGGGSHDVDMVHLAELGFQSYGKLWSESMDINRAESIIDTIGSSRKDSTYPIDGIVFKINNTTLWDACGGTDHHPNYAVAYKFPASEEDGTEKFSNLKDVEFSVADSGRITPVAIFDPVMLYGTKVQRISLASYNKFQESAPWHVGDTIKVTKGGEIIPKILAHHHTGIGNEITFPAYCPICGAPVTIDGAYAYCLNESCPKKQKPTVPSSGERKAARAAQPNLFGDTSAVKADTTTGNELAGMNIVVSGNFGDPASKANIKAMVTQHGGHLQDSVNGKTTHLVCGATGVGPAKIAKAERMGVRIINKDEFLEMVK